MIHYFTDLVISHCALDFGILFLLGAKGAGAGSDVVLMFVVAMMFDILIFTKLN